MKLLHLLTNQNFLTKVHGEINFNAVFSPDHTNFDKFSVLKILLSMGSMNSFKVFPIEFSCLICQILASFQLP